MMADNGLKPTQSDNYNSDLTVNAVQISILSS